MKLVLERLLCMKVYKTLNGLNPCFMKELFKHRVTNRNVYNKYKSKLEISIVNQVTYGTKSLISFEPKIWNYLLKFVDTFEACEICCWSGKHFIKIY